MMGMSTPYELTGRTSQKARTRNALVAAARELMAEGINPTVEQAADRADISRTTSYRYFPNQRALLLATYPELEAPTLLEADASNDPVERVAAVAGHYTAQVLEYEHELCAQLRLSLEPSVEGQDLHLRKGRAIGWYEDALAPLRDRMPAAEVHRVALAIRAATGIEAFVWLTGIAGLSREEAGEIMRFSARAIAESAATGAERR